MNIDSSLEQVAEILARLELSTINIELRTKLRGGILDTVANFVANKVDARGAERAGATRAVKAHEALHARAPAGDEAADIWAALHEEVAAAEPWPPKAGRLTKPRKPKSV